MTQAHAARTHNSAAACLQMPERLFEPTIVASSGLGPPKASHNIPLGLHPYKTGTVTLALGNPKAWSPRRVADRKQGRLRLGPYPYPKPPVHCSAAITHTRVQRHSVISTVHQSNIISAARPTTTFISIKGVMALSVRLEGILESRCPRAQSKWDQPRTQSRPQQPKGRR